MAAPSNWLALAVVLSILATARGTGKWRNRIYSITAILGIVCLVLPTGPLLLGLWEAKFTPVRASTLSKPTGIIVLAGSERLETTKMSGSPHLSNAAERLLGAIDLAQRFPDVPLVHVSGIERAGVSEAEVARQIFALGRTLALDMPKSSEPVFITGTYSTHTNAVGFRDWIERSDLSPDGWLLVTSASHMYRAHAAFRKQGIAVIPYPVDYRIVRPFSWQLFLVPTSEKLKSLDGAAYEIIGSLVYRLRGWI